MQFNNFVIKEFNFNNELELKDTLYQYEQLLSYFDNISLIYGKLNESLVDIYLDINKKYAILKLIYDNKNNIVYNDNDKNKNVNYKLIQNIMSDIQNTEIKDTQTTEMQSKYHLNSLCEKVFNENYKSDLYNQHDFMIDIKYSYYEIDEKNYTCTMYYSYVTGDCGCSSYTDSITIPLSDLGIRL